MSPRLLEDVSFNQSSAFDARPPAGAFATTLRFGEAERCARFVREGLAKIAALAALPEAQSDVATLSGDTRLFGTKFRQFCTADLRSAETALMDRALAA